VTDLESPPPAGALADTPARLNEASPKARLIDRFRATAPPWLVAVVAAWLGTRLLVYVAAWAAASLWSSGTLDHIEPVAHAGKVTFWDVIGGWDGLWYQRIAEYGYPAHISASVQSAAAFFPLVPASIAAPHALGLPIPVSAFFVSAAAGLGALIAIAALTEQFFGPEMAQRTAIYVAICPAGYVLSMPYSEPFAMAAGFGAAAFAMQRRAGPAAALGVLAGLTRSTGVLFTLPLLVLAYRRRSRSLALVALTPIVGLVIFSVFLVIRTGDPFAFRTVQAAWGRGSVGAVGFIDGGKAIVRQFTPHSSLSALRDLTATLTTLALLLYAGYRRMPIEWVVFGLLAILIPLASGSLQSLERFALLALPAYWVLAQLGRRTWFDGIYRIVAPGLMAMTVLALPVHWP
jgi:hypothetical protein